MNYKVLYRKYRPDSFENIIGQEFIIKTLQNSIVNQKIAHAYIFTGPRGTGKTSTAKVFAKVINCLDLNESISCGKCFNCVNNTENPDIIEIDAASNNGVDEIRELRNNVKISPNNSKYKIYIIDEVHMLSTEAFNALLKTLEEPPQHVIFILATTDIQKVPMTILSRCQRFDFKKISNIDMYNRLKEICKIEKIKIDDDALKEISYISDGSFRDALSLLDQLNVGGKVDIDSVSKVSGSISNKNLTDLFESLINQNAQIISQIIKQITDIGVNYKFFVEKFVQILKNQAVELKNSSKKSNINYETLKNMIFELVNSLNITKNTSNPFLIAELILLENILIKKEENYVYSEEKIISREIILEKEEEKNQKSVDKDVEKEEKNKKIKDYEELEKFKEIRINNCFVNASKEHLKDLQNKWKELLDNIKFTNQEICCLLIDSKIVAASGKYVIIEVEDESQSNLLNKCLSIIEKEFIVNEKKYKLIFLTKKEWEKEKKIYIENKKRHYEYKLLKEIVLANSNKKSKIETVALEIFDTAKIEIK